ncbi:signal peptidase II [Labrenzia sp. PHM005]|uniref:signal peptidase II n=1 Tax=Labrenzia sp. PHM005 TaxID=2590016 RepID=UPI001140312C|nr:signal peptidase II [Labrenzia sp. PHM005]
MTPDGNQPSEPLKRPYIWGRFSGFVFVIAAVCLILDQVTKVWIVHSADVATNGPIKLLPILDLILIWNRGISYGLFQQDSDLGRWLLALFTVAATIALWVWSTRVPSKLPALALALIIGGAIGNGIDRVVYGAVVDFVYFHVGSFSWYVFNLADVWIVAGVAGLLYDSFTNGPNSAAN